MAVFSLHRFIVVINGVTFDEWDASTDSFSFTPLADKMAFVESFGSHIFIDTGSRAHVLQIKLPQHSALQKTMRDWANQQDRDISSINFTLRAFDPINGDEITGAKGQIQTASGVVRGNGHNPNTWSIVFPVSNIKESQTNQG